jgi:hypothetical protein
MHRTSVARRLHSHRSVHPYRVAPEPPLEHERVDEPRLPLITLSFVLGGSRVLATVLARVQFGEEGALACCLLAASFWLVVRRIRAWSRRRRIAICTIRRSRPVQFAAVEGESFRDCRGAS